MVHCHQKTIKQKIQLSGKGLHTGQNMDVILIPQPINTGLWFIRTDNPNNQPIQAASEFVSDTTLATTIGQGAESISTVEHLLAALGGLGINNLRVEVCGPEVPIFDGSAMPWVELFKTVGLQTFNAPRPYYLVRRPFHLREGDRFVYVEPASVFSVDFTIDFPGFIQNQRRLFTFSESGFVNDIASARTFCLLSEVEKMQKSGKALGGGLDNAVVYSDTGILNPEGLRFTDECVRHKILDFIGDLTLAGPPIAGRFTAHKSGHSLNQRFLSAILAEETVLEMVNPSEIEKSSFRSSLGRLTTSPLKEAWVH
jgi:UDP-3-O-[3-hydroxymyristoyl] N-acetylglucosamine deacetylase